MALDKAEEPTNIQGDSGSALTGATFLEVFREMRVDRRLFPTRVVKVVFLILLLSGCGHFGFPTYYDPTTYKHLTDLKPEVLMLYDSFRGNADPARIDAVRLKLAQAYEYEKGKGPRNSETTEQIKIIQEMFEDHVSDRMKDGQWSYAHLENQKSLVGQAFDIAIKTERLKNKNE